MYKREDLAKKTSKELLAIAKDLKIVGRHDMRKEQLIEAIVSNQTVVALKIEAKTVTSASAVKKTTNGIHPLETELAKGGKEEWDNTVIPMDQALKKYQEPVKKDSYIENAKIGTIIAFHVNNSKVISGMIEEVHKTDFLVKTKNGVRFTVRKSNIIWVKTGPRWPRGVYLALRGELPSGECQANH
jgi:hypothetical protein